MKRYVYFIILFIILISGCSQKPAEVVYKKGGIYNPTYSEVYVESPDGKIARSLRGQNNSNKAQEINIINKDIEEEKSDDETTYTVKSGDSLWSIAKNNDVNIAELADTNNLSKPYNIKIGQKLKISEKNPTKINLSAKSYTVQSGDNLSSIANKFDMKTVELAELNDIQKPYSIRIGQKLKIKQGVADKEDEIVIKKSSKTGIYIVKAGDNLSSIANSNDMSLGELAELNDIDKPYSVRIGQKLKINKEPTIVVKNTQKPIKEPKTVVSTPKLQVSNNTNKKNSFIWPVKGDIVSSFGNKSNGLYNDGINISASKGIGFKATENGVVAYVGNELRGYGTIILVKHNDNWISAYAHCDSVKVARGDKVEKGQVLGTVGQSGNVSSPQLYFSLRSGREAVDPIKYLE